MEEIMKRITSNNPGRYTGKTNSGYKRLQIFENIIIDKYNIETYEDLDEILGSSSIPLEASEHIHNISRGNLCARCTCGNLVYDSEYHTDQYCCECGRKIKWDKLRKQHSELLKKKKELAELLERIKNV